MYRVINKYMENIRLVSTPEIYAAITDYLSLADDIDRYTVTVNFNRYMVDIRLDEFTVDKAAQIFKKFDAAVSYPYSSMSVRFNEGKCVRYRFITCKEDKSGFYCDIVISPNS